MGEEEEEDEEKEEKEEKKEEEVKESQVCWYVEAGPDSRRPWLKLYEYLRLLLNF